MFLKNYFQLKQPRGHQLPGLTDVRNFFKNPDVRNFFENPVMRNRDLLKPPGTPEELEARLAASEGVNGPKQPPVKGPWAT